VIEPAQTLSVVVPVHNAESTLAASVTDLLDVLADLTAHFEVLIIDDGSTDQTEDVAHDLSQRYPQVEVARHAEQRGIEVSAQTGAARTSGEVVIVHAGQTPVNTSLLKRMWELRDHEKLVVSRCDGDPGAVCSDVFHELVDWRKDMAGPTADRPNAGKRTALQRLHRRDASQPRTPSTAPIPAPTFRISPAVSRGPAGR
jgi:cellulose synthase/poly-beta-1,6-N-acetylglucosamine synthase-like glycosyltransferase